MFATIYTDAAYRFSDKLKKDLFGYSFYTRCDAGVYSGSGLIHDASCVDINYAEMYCIVRAIRESHIKFDNISRVLIVTDSTVAQYTLWEDHEEHVGLSLGSKKNKYLNVISEFKSLENKFEKIMIKWTKGHRIDNTNRSYLNNKVDSRAGKAISDYIKKYANIN